MIVSYKWRFVFVRTHKTASKSMEIMLARLCGDRDIVSPRGASGPAQNYRGLFNVFADLYYGEAPNRAVLRRFFTAMRYYNHMTAGQIRRRIGSQDWDSFYKFCFERNPWDKVVSHYWYRAKNPRKDPVGSFEDYLKLRRCPVDHPLYTINGELAVDKVGKYENLEADWREILSQIGLPVKDLSERLNTWQRSSSEPYLQYYNEYTRKVVADLYAREINLFGYQFGD